MNVVTIDGTVLVAKHIQAWRVTQKLAHVVGQDPEVETEVWMIGDTDQEQPWVFDGDLHGVLLDAITPAPKPPTRWFKGLGIELLLVSVAVAVAAAAFVR